MIKLTFSEKCPFDIWIVCKSLLNYCLSQKLSIISKQSVFLCSVLIQLFNFCQAECALVSGLTLGNVPAKRRCHWKSYIGPLNCNNHLKYCWILSEESLENSHCAMKNPRAIKRRNFFSELNKGIVRNNKKWNRKLEFLFL